MVRRLMACALVMALLAGWPPAGALAQTNPKDTGIVAGEGAGQYVQAAAPSLLGAFDRATSELDASPADATPRQVKDASFRRRILELRLLMDLNAFAYDKDQLKIYREIVDRSYEAIGVYQDITDIEKELGTPVSPEVVASRKVEMDDGLVQFRDSSVRNQMRSFLASPLKGVRKGGGPGIWDLTSTVASSDFDATGNAALLQTGVVRYLQGVDLGVNDIFDPNQALYFHLIRKLTRDVVILSAMYPDINGATREVVKPLDDLVGDYGDVMEAFNAYTFAQQSGLDTSKVEAELRREFEKAQATKAQFVETHALDAMAIRLNEVRDAHRR